LWFPAADTVAASTAGTERLRIDSSGNVGIGTTSPNYLFNVGATNAVTSLAGAGVTLFTTGALTSSIGGVLNFRPCLGTTASDIFNLSICAYDHSGDTNADGLSINGSDGVSFCTGSNSRQERMRIDSSGNVGIGTSSPTNKLDVVGNFGLNNTNAIKFKNAAGTYQTTVQWDSGDNILIGDSSNSTNSILKFYAGSAFGQTLFYGNNTERMRIDSSGNVGIGTGSPSYQLQVNTDSAGKPGVGGLWTVVSDERIKSNIVPANLDRCYEIVKSVPLKHFGFAPGVYTDDQIQDKHNLGWIAQDVQKVFKNAVSVKPFTLKTDIHDGVEEYEEQDFTLESVEKTETEIKIIDGKPVQVSKVVTSENKVLLFDTVDVVDEAGDAVMDGDKPLTYQMPRMVTKTRPKVRHDVIEDCLDLNGGQMIAALYGAVQALMAKVEAMTPPASQH
jgi:hypothetical protein